VINQQGRSHQSLLDLVRVICRSYRLDRWRRSLSEEPGRELESTETLVCFHPAGMAQKQASNIAVTVCNDTRIAPAFRSAPSQ